MAKKLTEAQLHRRILTGKATREQIVRGIRLKLERRSKINASVSK